MENSHCKTDFTSLEKDEHGRLASGYKKETTNAEACRVHSISHITRINIYFAFSHR